MTFRHIFSGEFWLTAILYSRQWRLAAILTAASQTSNLNVSANSKQNSKIFYDMNQGHRWVWFMKKTRGKKSRATVPLILTSFGGNGLTILWSKYLQLELLPKWKFLEPFFNFVASGSNISIIINDKYTCKCQMLYIKKQWRKHFLFSRCRYLGRRSIEQIQFQGIL